MALSQTDSTGISWFDSDVRPIHMEGTDGIHPLPHEAGRSIELAAMHAGRLFEFHGSVAAYVEGWPSLASFFLPDYKDVSSVAVPKFGPLPGVLATRAVAPVKTRGCSTGYRRRLKNAKSLRATNASFSPTCRMSCARR